MSSNRGRITLRSGNWLIKSIAQSQGRNIRRYAEYLITRARAFEATQTDYVRNGPGRLKRLSVEKGLLRETEYVQKQIRALLRADVGDICCGLTFLWLTIPNSC